MIIVVLVVKIFFILCINLKEILIEKKNLQNDKIRSIHSRYKYILNSLKTFILFKIEIQEFTKRTFPSEIRDINFNKFYTTIELPEIRILSKNIIIHEKWGKK